MSLLDRFRKHLPPPAKNPPPENAHGQRNIDGSYFTVWLCQNGHAEIGEPDKSPDRECMECRMETMTERLRGMQNGQKAAMPAAPPVTTYRAATSAEALNAIFKLEGFGMYSGVGFRMLV